MTMQSTVAGVRVGRYTMYQMQTAGGSGEFPPQGGRFLNSDGQTCGNVGASAVEWIMSGACYPVSEQSYSLGINDRGDVIGMTLGSPPRAFCRGKSLDFLDGFEVVWAINNQGVIAGTYNGCAALWVPGTGVVPLHTSGGMGVIGQAIWVNEKQEAAGVIGAPEGGKPYYWYADGRMVQIANHGGSVLGINGHSQVVGLLNPWAGGGQGYFWNGYDPANPELQMIPVAGTHRDVSISEAGMIAGWTAGGFDIAYRWFPKDPEVTPLPSLPDLPLAATSDINRGGTIVGWAYLASPHPDPPMRGVVWDPDNNITDLGPGTKALAVNDQGMVAGTSNGQPVVWVPTP